MNKVKTVKEQLESVLKVIDSEKAQIHYQTAETINDYRKEILSWLSTQDAKTFGNLVRPIEVHKPKKEGFDFTISRKVGVLLCYQLLDIIENYQVDK